MAVERTFSIVKPDGVAKNLIGEVYRRFEKAGLQSRRGEDVAAAAATKPKVSTPSTRRGRSIADLVRYMTSGPVVVQVLEGENAVKANRDIMGATNPKQAAPRHDSRRLCCIDRGERRARLGRPGDGARPKSPFFSAEAEICPRTR